MREAWFEQWIAPQCCLDLYEGDIILRPIPSDPGKYWLSLYHGGRERRVSIGFRGEDVRALNETVARLKGVAGIDMGVEGERVA